MRLPQSIFYLFAFIATIQAIALPAAFSSIAEAGKELYKRKGGGGGGGKGGGGGVSSGSSSSGSRSGSSSSSSSSSGSGGRSSGLGSSTSNTGGRTVSGSGARPAYGGSYAGGAAVPYRAGSTARGGIAPYFIGGAALGVLPGLWLYGAYAYPYGHAYPYHNDTTNRNETANVTCLCGQYSTCGCDNNTEYSYLSAVANNYSISRVTDINGTTLVINGTLENGTTASGGTETLDSAAGSMKQQILEMSGWWMVLAGVTYTMWFM